MADSKGPCKRQAGKKGISDEAVLKVTKEVVVKFIEVGRLSPANFAETFAEVHRVVRRAAAGGEEE